MLKSMSTIPDESILHPLLRVLSLWRRRRLQEEADRFARALTHLRADRMRSTRFLEWLAPMPDELAVDALEYLLGGTQADRTPFRAVMSTLIDVRFLTTGLGEHRINQWRRVAAQRDAVQVSAMLSLSPPGRRYYRPGHEDVNEYLETSLGWRKALARRHDRMTLDRLLHDKHPGVIRILLDNPRLVERDVVKMAALQPSSAAALETIFTHPRWIRRYAVKKALVFNPYSSPGMAMTLLAFLNLEDLRAATRSLNLSSQVRHQARALLDARRASRAPVPITQAETPPGENDRPQASKRRLSHEVASAADAFLSGLDRRKRKHTPLRPSRIGPRTKRDADARADRALGDEAARFLRSLPTELPLVPVAEAEDMEAHSEARPPPVRSPPSPPARHQESGAGDAGREEIETLAADFLAQLPGTLPLVPVDSSETVPEAPNAPRDERWVCSKPRETSPPGLRTKAPPVSAPAGPPPDEPPIHSTEVDRLCAEFMKHLPEDLPLIPVRDDEDDAF